MIEGASWRKWVFFYIPMALFLLFLLFPFYWMVITSIRRSMISSHVQRFELSSRHRRL
jgi:ABC-type glycerol-3-phosphate transport system permease component